MNFYLITQQGAPQAGWAQQYTMDLKPSGARTYEPNALLPGYTRSHIRLLLNFYQLTGETKFLARIPEALDWLESCRLPEHMTDGGKYTHPTFVEIGTNKPIFVHRRGSNVVHGEYYVDYNHTKWVRHYGGKSSINVDALRKEYERIKAISPEEASKNSPLITQKFEKKLTPQNYYVVKSQIFHQGNEGPIVTGNPPTEEDVKKVISALDSKGRWLSKRQQTSNPYIGDGTKTELTDQYAETHVGDETDTSQYSDKTDQEYIATRTYIRNMTVLIRFILSQ